MSFDWHDYFDFAQRLSQSSEFLSTYPEATQRTIISRTYYSAFKLVHNFLKDSKQIAIPRNENVHGFVINEMLNSNDSRYKIIGSNLERLRFIRNLADYQDNLYDRNGRTEIALELAQEILSDLSHLFS